MDTLVKSYTAKCQQVRNLQKRVDELERKISVQSAEITTGINERNALWVKIGQLTGAYGTTQRKEHQDV
jgi:tetrahydromethanopterin S-methyltransferase subunit G